jgi:outer membrane immunogenic protein
MKSLWLASLTLAAIAAGPALAADMPTRAPVYTKAPMAPPPPSWTGCYIDAGGGYGFYNQEHQSILTPGSGAPLSQTSSTGGEGYLGRFGAGCDYQFALGGLGNWVIGAFGDYDWAHIHDTFQNTFSGFGGDENESSAWSVGGRIGYLVTPGLLTYFDGGYTQTHFNTLNYTTATTPFTPFSSPSHTYNGWFLGGGTEYAMNFSWLPIQGLFWRNEYRYATYDAANFSILTAAGTPTGIATNIRPYTQTLTSSLVWRFNWMGH